MKRAFTLIELIFVIVIIGLLAAVAVPKFLNLKQSAEAASVIKTTIDAAQQAVETAINYRDLEDKVFKADCDDSNSSNFCLSDIVVLKGKGWKFIEGNNTVEVDRFEYNDSVTHDLIAEINMSETEVNYSINCNNFSDSKTVVKCKKELNASSISVHLPY